jgi:hypothetical protein
VKYKKKIVLLGFFGILMGFRLIQSVSASELQVHVVDINNQPLYGISFYLKPLSGTNQIRSNTKIDGVCTFKNLENIRYNLRFQGSIVNDYYDYDASIDIVEGENQHQVKLRKLCSLALIIKYEDGTPADDIRVEFQGKSGCYEQSVWGDSTTDKNGVVTSSRLPEDQYTIIIKNMSGTEITRYTENVVRDVTNQFTYSIKKSGSNASSTSSAIPSFSVFSLVIGLTAYLMNFNRRNEG